MNNQELLIRHETKDGTGTYKLYKTELCPTIAYETVFPAAKFGEPDAIYNNGRVNIPVIAGQDVDGREVRGIIAWTRKREADEPDKWGIPLVVTLSTAGLKEAIESGISSSDFVVAYRVGGRTWEFWPEYGDKREVQYLLGRKDSSMASMAKPVTIVGQPIQVTEQAASGGEDPATPPGPPTSGPQDAPTGNPPLELFGPPKTPFDTSPTTAPVAAELASPVASVTGPVAVSGDRVDDAIAEIRALERLLRAVAPVLPDTVWRILNHLLQMADKGLFGPMVAEAKAPPSPLVSQEGVTLDKENIWEFFDEHAWQDEWAHVKRFVGRVGRFLPTTLLQGVLGVMAQLEDLAEGAPEPSPAEPSPAQQGLRPPDQDIEKLLAATRRKLGEVEINNTSGPFHHYIEVFTANPPRYYFFALALAAATHEEVVNLISYTRQRQEGENWEQLRFVPMVFGGFAQETDKQEFLDEGGELVTYDEKSNLYATQGPIKF